MRAVIIAAGKGTRLSPLSDTRPKTLIPIGGKTILDHLLLTLKSAGVRDAVIVIGYMGETIRNRFKDGSSLGMHLQYVQQEKPRGTADALATTRSLVEEDDFLAVYGDLFVSSNAVEPLLKSEYSQRTAMAVVKVDDAWNYGVVNLSKDRVEEISEKPTDMRKGGQWINAGIYRFNRNIFEVIRKISTSPRGELELTDAINALTNLEPEVLGIRIDPKDWMDIGRPWDLLEANKRALSRLDRKIEGDVQKGTHLHGLVFVARGARVRSGAYIEGPAFIDENADVGPNCFIRPYTYLGHEVRIGHACEIKNSLVLGRSHIGHLSYVGDSIVGENCNLGAGTVTANLRFDEGNVMVMVKSDLIDSGRQKLGVIMGDRVKTAVNVSIMPGVKIGCNSWIGPNVTLTRDVEANTLVSQRTQYETSNIE